MKQLTRQRLASFFTAFFATLLAMGLVLSLLFLAARLRGEAPAEEPPRPTVYLPGAEERLTLLAAGVEETGMAPDLFVLLGFFPDDGRIALCVLPPGVRVSAEGQEDTLASLYEKGGLAYLQKRLAAGLGIPLDRIAQVELADLEALLAARGLMDYHLPAELSYTLRGRTVFLPPGRYRLDGRTAADILLCPNYPGGELERSDRGAMLLSRMVSDNLPAFLSDAGDALMDRLFAWIETDLSRTDYHQRKEALAFLARLDLSPVGAVFLDGTETAGGSILLTEGCLARLRAAFGEGEGAAASEGVSPAGAPP